MTLKEAGHRGSLNKDADPTLEGYRGDIPLPYEGQSLPLNFEFINFEF